jgi:hypothetical protein
MAPLIGGGTNPSGSCPCIAVQMQKFVHEKRLVFFLACFFPLHNTMPKLIASLVKKKILQKNDHEHLEHGIFYLASTSEQCRAWVKMIDHNMNRYGLFETRMLYVPKY